MKKYGWGSTLLPIIVLQIGCMIHMAQPTALPASLCCFARPSFKGYPTGYFSI